MNEILLGSKYPARAIKRKERPMRTARLGASLAALTAGAGLILGGAGVAQAAPVIHQAPSVASAASSVATPVTGTFTDANGGTGTFAGTFTPTRFVNQNGQLAAVGNLTGTLKDSSGNSLGTVSQQTTAPAAVANGTCDILNLDLGPLDLNLLGLKVHLNEVVLNITAQAGPGNLLGNLLCAVAGLLDGTGAGGGLDALVALLNQILAIL
ncbi:hypothetical protein ACFFWC_21430 [Plantactinospora siamensis]|uniref:ABC transporter substrate-binding protein n=1 Tax=Plantactinospora siamensis TaxID=555372 RepID=A0ABV6P5H2_9ACTN